VQKVLLPVEDPAPVPNAWFFGSTEFPPENGTSIGSSVFVGLTVVKYRQADRSRGVAVSGVRRINEVNARRARLVLGWATVFGRIYHLGT